MTVRQCLADTTRVVSMESTPTPANVLPDLMESGAKMVSAGYNNVGYDCVDDGIDHLCDRRDN